MVLFGVTCPLLGPRSFRLNEVRGKSHAKLTSSKPGHHETGPIYSGQIIATENTTWAPKWWFNKGNPLISVHTAVGEIL